MKALAVTLLAVALVVLFLSGYRAITTPWTKVVTPMVWNRVNPVDVTKEIVESAGPGGRIMLHLAGISAQPNMDNVQVYLEAGLVKQEGTEQAVRLVHLHVASLILESRPMDGTGDAVFDVTQAITSMLNSDPDEIRGFTVEFAQVPKNSGVKQTDESFFVEWTYLELYDAAGNPVAQKPELPKYDDIASNRKDT